MKIAFLLGSPDISGGTYVIFQHALAALKSGLDVSIVTWDIVAQNRLDWFPEAKKFHWCTYETVAETQFNMVIATWWKTVFELYRVQATHYVYFVQSIESKFYVEAEKPLRNLVDSTYTMPLIFITEATWIQAYLKEHYNQSAFLVRNGIRKDVYQPQGPSIAPREPGKLRVLVEGTVDAPFKNVPKTIELCLASEADEVWFMTPSPIKDYPGVARCFSQVPVTKTAEVYRSCDVLVKLSYVEGMFGPPLEIFHCGGTSITYDVTGHDEYIVPEENGIIVPTDREADVIAAINRLKREPELLAQLKQGACVTAQAWPDWSASSALFLQTLIHVQQQPAPISQRDIEILSKFSFESYVIAENYRLQLLPSSESTPIRLKGFIKRKHPKIFAFLKKIKQIFFPARI